MLGCDGTFKFSFQNSNFGIETTVSASKVGNIIQIVIQQLTSFGKLLLWSHQIFLWSETRWNNFNKKWLYACIMFVDLLGTNPSCSVRAIVDSSFKLMNPFRWMTMLKCFLSLEKVWKCGIEKLSTFSVPIFSLLPSLLIVMLLKEKYDHLRSFVRRRPRENNLRGLRIYFVVSFHFIHIHRVLKFKTFPCRFQSKFKLNAQEL